ncbi:MAG: 50S ribosomal protein L4 [Thermoleophilia bacterium]
MAEKEDKVEEEKTAEATAAALEKAAAEPEAAAGPGEAGQAEEAAAESVSDEAAAGPEAVEAEAEAAEVEEAAGAEETAAQPAEKAEAKPAAEKAKAKPARKAAKKAKAKAARKQARPKQEIKVPQVTALDEKDAGLKPEVFAVEPKLGVLHEVVRAEFASMRRGTASSKNRAEVSGGGVKPWRQKGTGRARAGSSRMPHWTGGGITFGPTPRDFSFKVNRKVRKQALKMALSVRVSEGSLKVVDALPFDEPKTAAAAAVLSGMDVNYPLLVLLTEADENAAMSFRNIPRVDVTDTGDLLVSDIMAARTVLVTREAVEQLNAMGDAK